MTIDIDALTLPPRTHAKLLTDLDGTTGNTVSRWILWADRWFDRCPQCREPVPRIVENCPAILHLGQPGCPAEDTNQEHGCGRWLHVDWLERPGGATEAEILSAANDLAANLKQVIAEEEGAILGNLFDQLRDAMARLSEPLDDDETVENRAAEVATGSDAEPGVYRGGDGWVAWDYHPDGSGDMITVRKADLLL